MTSFWVISVENQVFSGYQRRRYHSFRLSASKMSYFWVVSVEHDLFSDHQCRRLHFRVIRVENIVSGYQRRRDCFFELSASQTTYFQIISVYVFVFVFLFLSVFVLRSLVLKAADKPNSYGPQQGIWIMLYELLFWMRKVSGNTLSPPLFAYPLNYLKHKCDYIGVFKRTIEAV